jgi:hypothetical protein
MDINIEEIVMRLTRIIGEIVFKIKKWDFHLKYKTNFVDFFNTACTSKELDLRRHAAYNLPCFNLLYRED